MLFEAILALLRERGSGASRESRVQPPAPPSSRCCFTVVSLRQVTEALRFGFLICEMGIIINPIPDDTASRVPAPRAFVRYAHGVSPLDASVLCDAFPAYGTSCVVA